MGRHTRRGGDAQRLQQRGRWSGVVAVAQVDVLERRVVGLDQALAARRGPRPRRAAGRRRGAPARARCWRSPTAAPWSASDVVSSAPPCSLTRSSPVDDSRGQRLDRPGDRSRAPRPAASVVWANPSMTRPSCVSRVRSVAVKPVEVVDDVGRAARPCPPASSVSSASPPSASLRVCAVALEVVGQVLDRARRSRRVEGVEELLQRGQGLVGLDRDLRALQRDDRAVASPWLALGPRREELHVALADQRQRHDGRLHVRRDRLAPSLMRIFDRAPGVDHLDVGDLPAGRPRTFTSTDA